MYQARLKVRLYISLTTTTDNIECIDVRTKGLKLKLNTDLVDCPFDSVARPEIKIKATS